MKKKKRHKLRSMVRKIFEGKGSNPALDLNAVTIRLREQKEIAQSKQVMLFYDEYRENAGFS